MISTKKQFHQLGENTNIKPQQIKISYFERVKLNPTIRSKKRTNYSSAFKTKLVLELLQNESTLAQIASKHNILPQNLVNWKKIFLANAEIAMEPSKAVKEYKEELIKSQEQNERLTTLVGVMV
ncbi:MULTISPECIES: transposase [sulfur-oxidizing symbionts]|uniref:transposase n=1 Tax=sulfur-oxidizing symbionts TaxID=32036 RepID=UPI00192AC15E|nr:MULTISPECIES: transposase [sulfur-oxidizing symbionts]